MEATGSRPFQTSLRKDEVFKIFRARIEFEYQLMSQRITWPLLLSGAAAAATLAVAGVNRGSDIQFLPLFVGLSLVTIMLCVVSVSVHAARKEVDRIDKLYRDTIQQSGLASSECFLDDILVGDRKTNHRDGDMLTVFVSNILPAVVGLLALFAGVAYLLQIIGVLPNAVEGG